MCCAVKCPSSDQGPRTGSAHSPAATTSTWPYRLGGSERFRGETDTLEKMRRRAEYDPYIDNWSFMFDVKIALNDAGF
jgi:hypothetical protein